MLAARRGGAAHARATPTYSPSRYTGEEAYAHVIGCIGDRHGGVGRSAPASEQSDVMAPIHQFVDGFNKGDVNSALAACSEETSIIDEFPPHEWHGAGACAKWANDYGREREEGRHHRRRR